MTRIEYFMKGYFRVEVKGDGTERFLNLCGNHGIMIWSIEREKNICYLNIPLESRSEIEPLLQKTNTEAVLLSEHGLPFLLRRCRQHISFFAGMLLCFILWGISRQCLWNIEYDGNSCITRNQLERYLLQKDIEIPMLLHRIDTEKLGEQIRQDFPVVTWVSVSLQGTTMSVHLKENELEEYDRQETDREEYKDLIASEDGIIVSMITRAGTPVKAVGDQVQRGDILVQGSYPVLGEDGTVRRMNYCRADADVIVASEERYTLHADLYDVEKNYAKRCVSFKWISLGGKELSPCRFLNPEKPQEIIKIYESGDMLLKQKFPIQFGTYYIRPYEKIKKQNTDEEMQKKTDRMIADLIKRIEQKGVQIRQKNVTIKKNEKKWDVDVGFLLWCRQETMADTAVMEADPDTPAE